MKYYIHTYNTGTFAPHDYDCVPVERLTRPHNSAPPTDAAGYIRIMIGKNRTPSPTTNRATAAQTGRRYFGRYYYIYYYIIIRPRVRYQSDVRVRPTVGSLPTSGAIS